MQVIKWRYGYTPNNHIKIWFVDGRGNQKCRTIPIGWNDGYWMFDNRGYGEYGDDNPDGATQEFLKELEGKLK